MLSINLKTAKTATLAPLFILSIIFFGCKQPPVVKHNGVKDLISFKPIEGISYSEIARRTEDGLSFNNAGYQLEPQWKMKFVSDDSVSIYSPTKKQFINFPLTRGYDSVFNTARTWLKVKVMTKDSLITEVLSAEADSVDTHGTRVYMTFYADNYVKNVLHGDLSKCKSPSLKDTAYIKWLSAAANKDPDKAFAARQPVQIKSKNRLVSIEKRVTEPTLLNNFDTSSDYMAPSFYIIINKAHTDFHYSFSVNVDEQGQMHYVKPLIPTTSEYYIDHSKAVMDSYLKQYLNLKPGTTLGIVHTSEIAIHVTGRRGA